MASMNEEQIKLFEERHIEMLEEFPEEFTIRHKVFLTYYYSVNYLCVTGICTILLLCFD